MFPRVWATIQSYCDETFQASMLYLCLDSGYAGIEARLVPHIRRIGLSQGHKRYPARRSGLWDGKPETSHAALHLDCTVAGRF